MRKEVTGDWRRLHNGELHNLYCCSLNIIVVIKPTRMEWTVWARAEVYTKFGWERQKKETTCKT
jgi:hypothetical protein